jgi:hypothetical protein
MQQVADWLERLGLSQYARCFAENDISFVILPDLTDQDLEKIGVASLGHRRLLLRSIAELKIVDKTTLAPDAAASAPPAAAKMDMDCSAGPAPARLFFGQRTRAVRSNYFMHG